MMRQRLLLLLLCQCSSSSTGIPTTTSPPATYPGDAYVDYIGLDMYDQGWNGAYPIPAGSEIVVDARSIRIQFDTACHTQKLIPYLGENRPGEVYERQGKSWKLVGIIKPEDKPYGIITAVDDDS